MKVEFKVGLQLTEEEYDVLVSASELLTEIAIETEMPEENKFQRLASNARYNIDTFLAYYDEEAEYTE